MGANGKEVEEMIQAVSSGCADSEGGDCHWKRKYLDVEAGYAELAATAQETFERADAMEKKVDSVVSMAVEQRKQSMTELAKLAEVNKTLESNNKLFVKQLEDLRTSLNNQLQSGSDTRKQMNNSLAGLEDLLTMKTAVLKIKDNERSEMNKRIDFLKQEVQNKEGEITELRKGAAEMQQRFESDLRRLALTHNKKQADIHKHYVNEMKAADINFIKTRNKLSKSQILLSQFVKMATTDNEHVVENELAMEKCINKKLKKAYEEMDKMESLGRMAVLARKQMENDMDKAAQALQLLKMDIEAFYLESNKSYQNVFKENALRTRKNRPEVLPTQLRSYLALKSIEHGFGRRVSEVGCKILELVQKERLNTEEIGAVPLMMSLRIESESQKQIQHLEEAVRLEKMKYIRDIDLANKKLTVAKKLIKTLRKKPEPEMQDKTSINVAETLTDKAVGGETGHSGNATAESIPDPPKPSSTCAKTSEIKEIPPLPIGVPCGDDYKGLLEQSERVLEFVEKPEEAPMRTTIDPGMTRRTHAQK